MATIIIITCVVLSAFFSGVEIAYVSSNKIHIEIEKKQNNFLSKILSRLTRKPSRLLTTMLVGNSVSLVVYGFYFGNLIVEWLFPGFKDAEQLPFDILLVQTAISTVFILIMGEFTPKVFFSVYSKTLFKWSILPAYFFYCLFYPVTIFLIGISNFIMKYVFKTAHRDNPLMFTKSELNYYISEQIESVEDQEQIEVGVEIFRNALNFSKIKARDAMIPRTDICAISIDESPKKLASLFIKTGYSKILIFDKSIDDIVGYVYSFELFKKPKDIKAITLPIEYVPETMPVINVLNILIRKRKSIAVVLDEYGGTEGIITMEDIIEEVLGNIQDEHDSEDFIEEKINENEYRFSARLEVDYLNKTYRIGLPESETYETLGGLVVSINGNIPDAEEVITTDDFEFKIIEASDNKIITIQVTIL